MPPVDFFIVNVSLPSIQTSIGATSAELQLVVSGYASAYAVFLITGGRLGDLYGRRRLFLFGMAGFTAANLLCGLAATPATLVGGRILQGVAAAILVPQVLGPVRTLFPTDRELARALSSYGIMMGMAAVCGQFLGGALVEWSPFGLGWRAVFLLKVPVALAVLLAAWVVVPETSTSQRVRIDGAGAVLLSPRAGLPRAAAVRGPPTRLARLDLHHAGRRPAAGRRLPALRGEARGARRHAIARPPPDGDTQLPPGRGGRHAILLYHRFLCVVQLLPAGRPRHRPAAHRPGDPALWRRLVLRPSGQRAAGAAVAPCSAADRHGHPGGGLRRDRAGGLVRLRRGPRLARGAGRRLRPGHRPASAVQRRAGRGAGAPGRARRRGHQLGLADRRSHQRGGSRQPVLYRAG